MDMIYTARYTLSYICHSEEHLVSGNLELSAFSLLTSLFIWAEYACMEQRLNDLRSRYWKLLATPYLWHASLRFFLHRTNLPQQPPTWTGCDLRSFLAVCVAAATPR
jgi:hypothetical protein